MLFKKTKHSLPDTRDSFILNHNNGEIWVVCMDNLGDDFSLIESQINKNEELFGSSNCSGNILFHADFRSRKKFHKTLSEIFWG